MASGNCCDEKTTVASNTPLLIPELNQKKVYKKHSAKNEAKVEWVVKRKLLKNEQKKSVKQKLVFTNLPHRPHVEVEKKHFLY